MRLLEHFHIFSRGRPLADFGWLGADLHNHVLPGIDDGAPDTLTAARMIAGLASLGLATVYATPHVMAELYPNTPATVGLAAARLHVALGRAYGGVLAGAAAEYMLDEGFAAKLRGEGGGRLLTLPGRRLLVEWSLVGEPLGLPEALAGIRDAGYVPVLAHPERYAYWHGRFARLRELVEAGCELQVNLLSLTGRYGPGAREAGLRLLTDGLAAFAASDAHAVADVEALAGVLADGRAAEALRGAGLRNAALARA